MNTIQDEIKELLSNALGMDPSEINEDVHIDNTPRWDSLAHLRLIIEIESRFETQLDPGEVQKIIDYQSLYKIVNKLIKKGSF